MGNDTTRNITAGITGVGTAVIGTALPLVAGVAGLLFQTIERQRVQATPYEHVIDGLVDGSAALLARRVALALPAAVATGIAISPVPMAYPQAIPDDSDALVG